MAFFDFFPYTNWHNVNLDWVLQKVKEFGEKVEANDALYSQLHDEWEEFLSQYDEVNVMEGVNDLARVALREAPREYALFKQSTVLSGYNIGSVCHDGSNFYAVGGSRVHDGSGIIAKMSRLDFKSITTNTLSRLGHTNDVAYYDGSLYICTANYNGSAEGDAALNAVAVVDIGTMQITTVYSNCPSNTIGIARTSDCFWLLAPPYIYKTTNFTDFTRVISNADVMIHKAGIASSSRSAQTIFNIGDDMLGYVAAYNESSELSREQSYALISYFRTDGLPVGMATCACSNCEAEGAAFVNGALYIVTTSSTWPTVVLRSSRVASDYYSLYAGQDLNDLVCAGVYNCSGSDVAGSLTNSPVTTTGFTLTVAREGMFHTIQIVIDNDSHGWYRRRSWSSMTWSAWKQIVTLPAAPDTEGAYTLTCTVTDGSPAYTWEA